MEYQGLGEFIIAVVVAALVLVVVIFALSRLLKVEIFIESAKQAKSSKMAVAKIKQAISEHQNQVLREVAEKTLANTDKLFAKHIENLEKTTNDEIQKTVSKELKNYSDSLRLVQQKSLEAIDQSVSLIQKRNDDTSKQVNELLRIEKERMAKALEENMASVVSFYIEKALRDHVGVDDQIDIIIDELEKNKQTIIQDVQRGA